MPIHAGGLFPTSVALFEANHGAVLDLQCLMTIDEAAHFLPRNGINPKCRTSQTGTAKMAIAANRFQVHSNACA